MKLETQQEDSELATFQKATILFSNTAFPMFIEEGYYVNMHLYFITSSDLKVGTWGGGAHGKAFFEEPAARETLGFSFTHHKATTQAISFHLFFATTLSYLPP